MTRLWADGEPVVADTDDGGDLRAFVWHRRTHSVARVCQRWRVDTDWWSDAEAVAREYSAVITRDGLLCVLYCDEPGGDWLLARVYD